MHMHRCECPSTFPSFRLAPSAPLQSTYGAEDADMPPEELQEAQATLGPSLLQGEQDMRK